LTALFNLNPVRLSYFIFDYQDPSFLTNNVSQSNMVRLLLKSFAIFVLSCPVHAAPFPKAIPEPTVTTPYNASTSHWNPSSQVLQARKTDPGIGTPEGIDLARAGNSTMRRAGTFYRAAVERELAELHAAVGDTPFGIETARFEDFKVGDTSHMYLFPNGFQ
jgi:hypothetical protein